MGLLFIRITFQLGDGSTLDRWNKIASPIVVAILQIIALAQGIYMTFLMKGICYVKDEKSKNNYDKYLARSYILLACFTGINILGSVSYIVGVLIRGPRGSIDGYIYIALTNVAIACYSLQIVSLCFLFESIKAICVVSTFWTPKKVQIYKYISCLLLFLGFLGRLLSRITFTLGDGSVLDKVFHQ
ncbi:hypothetical protein BC833DRAFT_602486 [Globomyces pollinis-pini]|nr:hypothetical protein BC833DRAFT_602486 [Globomyces pollinis-pini]